MTQVVSLSYAQYPLTKKIGNDTVVIMTIKQGEQINKSFDEYEEKVSKLKDTITILKKQYDSSIGFVRSEISEYKWKYEENKKMYSKNEKLFYKIHNTDILQKILLGVIVTFLFFKLN